ncbi:hypothetical protein [Massilia sp. CFBP 13647]|uniref:hypothetical protein n=1 Tax=Massilia sp. CFBP 13647 TaxID=2775276 RepID=UPI001A7EAA7D|nr:hypothetical protein [Massilia sp. CFBP 13647]
MATTTGMAAPRAARSWTAHCWTCESVSAAMIAPSAAADTPAFAGTQGGAGGGAVKARPGSGITMASIDAASRSTGPDRVVMFSFPGWR